MLPADAVAAAAAAADVLVVRYSHNFKLLQRV